MGDFFVRNEARMTKEAAEKKVKHPKTDSDLQRIKIEKLMRKPDKAVHIPEPKKTWKPKDAPEFVRDVMGSSAGAGSGEFHVYRHIRRREFQREAYLNEMDKTQKLDEEYQNILKDNKEKAEKATAKKRAKRQRQKQKLQYMRKKLKQEKQKDNDDSKGDESDESGDAEEKEDDAEEQSFVMGGK